ncbi:HdeD family acid-resistance protein [Kribbella sp. NPDC058693]|uniref:HdeD family acid-resistance protein n=1 Tax=Kribbella jiaozuonensis TaxID=2575441 RepID=A0A4U3LF58_9ACTN|nr:HdeD family acid-resistance protein [Kribbella jiaozuonensis]TKK73384.1 HdeD family acid-resistance protein [Kribbella jiaozuonensis]
MERDWLTLGWKMLLVRGAIGIIFGILAIVWPIHTAIALALLWGIWALVDGIGSIAQAFQPESKGSRLWLVTLGVIALIAAFFAITSPGMAATTLTWILGIWLIVRGIFELAGAFSSQQVVPRWLLVLSGLLSILIGVLFAANPGAGAVSVAVVLGVTALVWGVVLIGVGFSVRRELHSGPAHSSPSPA